MRLGKGSTMISARKVGRLCPPLLLSLGFLLHLRPRSHRSAMGRTRASGSPRRSEISSEESARPFFELFAQQEAICITQRLKKPGTGRRNAHALRLQLSNPVREANYASYDVGLLRVPQMPNGYRRFG